MAMGSNRRLKVETVREFTRKYPMGRTRMQIEVVDKGRVALQSVTEPLNSRENVEAYNVGAKETAKVPHSSYPTLGVAPKPLSNLKSATIHDEFLLQSTSTVAHNSENLDSA